MTRDEFKKCLDLYSSDLSRWPQDRMKQALQLLEKDGYIKAYFEAELKVDEVLRGYAPSLKNQGHLQAKIITRIASAKQARGRQIHWPWRTTVLMPQAVGLMAAVLFGFFAGIQSSAEREFLLDPAFYQEQQIIADNSGLYEEVTF